MSRRVPCRFWFAALLALVGAGPAAAQPTFYTWTGLGSDDGWFTPENWSAAGPASPPPVNDIVNTVLTLAGTTRTTNTLDYSFAAQGLTFAADAGPFVVNNAATAQTLTLGGGGIRVASGNANAQTFNANLALGANQSWLNNGTAPLTVGSAVNGGANALTIGGTGNTFVSGQLTMSGPLTFNGPGTLSITGANAASLTGAIAVTGGGRLAYSTRDALGNAAGSGTITLDGGTLHNTTLGNAGTFVSVNRNIVLGAGGGTLRWDGDPNPAFTTPPLIIVQNISGAPGTVISGVGGLTKSGVGVIAVATPATYAGATRVAEGTLRVRSSSNIFPTATALTVDAGATFDLDSLNQQVASVAGAGVVNMRTATSTFTVGDANSTAFAGVIQGLGRVTKVGTGTLTLAGANTYTGTTTVSAGTLAVGGSLGSSAVTVAAGAALRGGAPGTTGTLTTAGNVIVSQNATFRFEASRSGVGAAAASALNLTGSAGLLNLNPGAGNRFVIDLVNGASSLVTGESYTVTLATVAAAGNIRLNGGGVGANATIDPANYVLRSDDFASFTGVSLGTDGTNTALLLSFTPVPVPEPATALALAAGALALGRAARRRLAWFA